MRVEKYSEVDCRDESEFVVLTMRCVMFSKEQKDLFKEK